MFHSMFEKGLTALRVFSYTKDSTQLSAATEACVTQQPPTSVHTFKKIIYFYVSECFACVHNCTMGVPDAHRDPPETGRAAMLGNC